MYWLSPLVAIGLLLFNTLISSVHGHGRLMEPVSRASAWRKGFPNPADYNDNEGYCGGYSHQWLQNNGKCGICGDPWGVSPQQHAAPGGRYANGIIVKEYRVGQIIDIEIDISANHRGSFIFKLCENNNIKRDAGQRCFDRHVLRVYPDMTDQYVLPNGDSQTFHMKLKLPEGVTCAQCVLQWTYNTANSWGNCPNGTQAIGCGPQETFRACSDIRISRSGNTLPIQPEINEISQAKPSKAGPPPTFKFVWIKGIDPPKPPDASTSLTTTTTRKPRKKPRKKISERPMSRKKKRRRNKKKKKQLFGPFVPPPPPPNADKMKSPYGYFSFSMGSADEDVNIYLGPGETDHGMDKLKEFQDVLESNQRGAQV